MATQPAYMTRRGLLGALSAGALATWALTACLPRENLSQLPVLLEDPMAATDLLGLELLSESQQGYETSLGKPSYTKVSRVFSLADSQITLDDAITEATQAGWQAERSDETWWSGNKEDPSREILITLDPPEEKKLSVYLEVTVVPSPTSS